MFVVALFVFIFALVFLLCVLVTNISIDSYLCQGHACTHGDSNRGQGNVLKLAVNAAMVQICNSLFVYAQTRGLNNGGGHRYT